MSIWDLLGDLFQLNMHSLVWTWIQTHQPTPQARSMCSFVAVTDNLLVLHGGCLAGRGTASDTWILDLTSSSWRLYNTSERDHARRSHMGCLGLNSSAIMIGGFKEYEERKYEIYNNMFCVMLKPKSLQKLALHKIYKNRAKLPWKCLPDKLLALLGGSAEQDSISSAVYYFHQLFKQITLTDPENLA